MGSPILHTAYLIKKTSLVGLKSKKLEFFMRKTFRMCLKDYFLAERGLFCIIKKMYKNRMDL